MIPNIAWPQEAQKELPERSPQSWRLAEVLPRTAAINVGKGGNFVILYVTGKVLASSGIPSAHRDLTTFRSISKTFGESPSVMRGETQCLEGLSRALDAADILQMKNWDCSQSTTAESGVMPTSHSQFAKPVGFAGVFDRCLRFFSRQRQVTLFLTPKSLS